MSQLKQPTKRTSRVTVRLEPSELSRLRLMAEKAGVSLSEAIRQLVLRALN